jgi:hypothetical protein
VTTLAARGVQRAERLAVTHALLAMSVLFVAMLAYLPSDGPPIE